MRASGEGSSKRTSMVSDLEHRNGSRSTSRVGETVEDEGELPELVLGFAEVEIGKKKGKTKQDDPHTEEQDITAASQQPPPAQESSSSLPLVPSPTVPTPIADSSSLAVERTDTRADR
ncbi:hypothetical protein FRC18_008894 [Serendipita sp. 400]|nr:hypothetical protein FRC18_008894 [Serendipita sp. 400]